MLHENLVLRALKGQKTERTPIWFMRQAGRYLPEYRALRQKHSFDALLADPELATEITLQPVRRFGLDAAIVFADIMTILAGLGVPYHFRNGGPSLEFRANDKAFAEHFNTQRMQDHESCYLPLVETLRAVRAALSPQHAVIGFAAAPFTLLSYLVENTTAKSHNAVRALLYAEPEKFHSYMQKITDCTIFYLKLQCRAGADAVQLFESWGEIVPEKIYAEHVLPYVRQIAAAISPQVPFIFYDKGASLHLPVLEPFAQETGTVLSLDWRVSLSKLPISVQGNLDPAYLESSPAAVRRECLRILNERNGFAHVFNLGHGISPEAKLECVEAMVETVKSFRAP
ncbi:MAG: uroporphyrinogen decarboxylase [Turneriella sp.]|nr:uroporphyrinogen decarboxylase [Turneriella sp.]